MSYKENNRLLKKSPNYKKLNSNMAQQILKEVDGEFQSFFALLEKTKRDNYPLSSVKLPKYLPKKGFMTLIIGFVRLNGNHQVNDYLNKTARLIINFCLNEKIGILVCGYNTNFQRGSKLGKVNNQNFVNIPYGKFREKLEYLCNFYGIKYVEQEESYTSQSSFWDKDEIPVYNANDEEKYKFSGRRIHRGMYKTSSGYKLNADVNGALNIVRKSNVVSLTGLYSRGEVDTPARIRVA